MDRPSLAPGVLDLQTGAVVALTAPPADRGDTVSLRTTLAEAGGTVTELAGQAAQADAVGPVETVSEGGVERVVADKGYHSRGALQDLAEVGVNTVIAEPERKRQQWTGQRAAQVTVYANRRPRRACDGGGSCSSGVSPTCMTRAACGGCICAGRTTSPSGRFCMRPPSI